MGYLIGRYLTGHCVNGHNFKRLISVKNDASSVQLISVSIKPDKVWSIQSIWIYSTAEHHPQPLNLHTCYRGADDSQGVREVISVFPRINAKQYPPYFPSIIRSKVNLESLGTVVVLWKISCSFFCFWEGINRFLLALKSTARKKMLTQNQQHFVRS